jgi:hypothetical protein
MKLKSRELRRCKNKRCGKEFKPKTEEQVYCSKDCAPYGRFQDDPRSFK